MYTPQRPPPVRALALVASLSRRQTCLGSSGTLKLETPTAVVSTKYPEDPSTTLDVFFNSTEGSDKRVLWKLEWVNDFTSVTWKAVPSTGLAFPGESITVSRWLGGDQRVLCTYYARTTRAALY